MVRGHHQLHGHKLEQTLGDSGGQRTLMCYSPWGHKESDTTEQLNNSNSLFLSFSTWKLGTEKEIQKHECPPLMLRKRQIYIRMCTAPMYHKQIASHTCAAHCRFLSLASFRLLSFRGLPLWYNGQESTLQCREHGFDSWLGNLSSHMPRGC